VVAADTHGIAAWGRAFGAWGQRNGDGNAAKLNRSTGGLFFGVDAPVSADARLGVVAGVGRTSFNVADRSSSGSSDDYSIGLYGGKRWGNLAFRSGVGYTLHDISTNRSVSFPGFSDNLKSNYRAGTAQAFGELGQGFDVGRARVEPFANLAYVNLHANGFIESGGAAALTGASSNTGLTYSTLGARVSTNLDVHGATLTLRGMAGWRHAFGDVTPLATMRFASGGDAFGIGGVPVARNAAVLEAGLDYALARNTTLSISYNGQFGSGVSDHSARLNFNRQF
jgi:outer membrane autotransporter protein